MDRINSFKRNLDVWKERMRKNVTDMFSEYTKTKLLESTGGNINEIIIEHLEKLREKFEYYFPPSNEKNEWIQFPFNSSSETSLQPCEEDNLIVII